LLRNEGLQDLIEIRRSVKAYNYDRGRHRSQSGDVERFSAAYSDGNDKALKQAGQLATQATSIIPLVLTRSADRGVFSQAFTVGRSAEESQAPVVWAGYLSPQAKYHISP
jgi:hypothetical protein